MEGKVLSDFRPRKCPKTKQQLEDRISQLPDDILANILSFLRLEDAARTCVLSKRWIDLWTFIPRLDFDASTDLAEIDRLDDPRMNAIKFTTYINVRYHKREKYVKWVNKVLQSHKSLYLDVFRIRFDLDESHQHHIDQWLQHALVRRLERMDLTLGTFSSKFSTKKSYVFPQGLLDTSLGFRSLKALSFRHIRVSGGVLNFFLHNCSFLEYLSVVPSYCLKRLEVCGPLALKHLELMACAHFQSLIICDSNIVSLRTSHGDGLLLKNVPMLVEVLVDEIYQRLVVDAVSWLSPLSQLEVLTLIVSFAEEGDDSVLVLPQLPKLKQFTLSALAHKDSSLIPFTSFMRASPNLNKFILELDWMPNTRRRRREHKRGVTFPLEHLKEVELRGYYGRTAEVELVEYLLENAVSLERIFVDPRRQPYYGFLSADDEHDEPEDQRQEMARKFAKHQLERLVPSHVGLAIL